jgi:branched-subunit amino acid aminotransferase/4-amino-4-deoxychorismate lyase
VWLSPYSIDAQSPLRGVKSTSYAPWHVMALEARERHCDEALYCTSRADALRGCRSNLFWRRGDTVFTPSWAPAAARIARAQILDWLNGQIQCGGFKKGSPPSTTDSRG